MSFGIMTFSIMTFSIMTFSIMTLNIVDLFATLSLMSLCWVSHFYCYSECHYVKCHYQMLLHHPAVILSHSNFRYKNLLLFYQNFKTIVFETNQNKLIFGIIIPVQIAQNCIIRRRNRLRKRPFMHLKILILLDLGHRHLSNIDCLMARTACLVCFISTVNGRSKKERKEAYLDLP